jgi:hypothetical protein
MGRRARRVGRSQTERLRALLIGAKGGPQRGDDYGSGLTLSSGILRRRRGSDMRGREREKREEKRYDEVIDFRRAEMGNFDGQLKSGPR